MLHGAYILAPRFIPFLFTCIPLHVCSACSTCLRHRLVIERCNLIGCSARPDLLKYGKPSLLRRSGETGNCNFVISDTSFGASTTCSLFLHCGVGRKILRIKLYRPFLSKVERSAKTSARKRRQKCVKTFAQSASVRSTNFQRPKAQAKGEHMRQYFAHQVARLNGLNV